MAGLKIAVVAMGILIVAGLALIATTLVGRMSAVGGSIASVDSASNTTVMLDEPNGTHIAGVSMAPDRMAVQLQGGGPDRVVFVDTRAGRVLGRVVLAR